MTTRPSFGALSFALAFATRVFGENVTDPMAMESLTWISDNLRALLDAFDAVHADKPADAVQIMSAAGIVTVAPEHRSEVES